MLNIRLARTGRKRDAHFRVVVSDSARGRVGRILETVGYYHPRMPNDAEGRFQLDRARARYWMDRGARPSDTVRSFLKNLPEPSADEPAAADGSAPAESAPAESAEPAEPAPETPAETPTEDRAEAPSAEAAPSESPSEPPAEPPAETEAG